MAINNPTKTNRIEAAFRRENRQRFKLYAKTVKDALKLSQQNIIRNAEDFEMSNEEFERFMRFLRDRAYTDIIGVTALENANSSVTLEQIDEWQTKYINAAYAKGIEISAKQVGTSIVAGADSIAEVQRLFGIASDENLARLLIGTNSLHGDSVRTVQTRALASLIQAVEVMLAQISRDVEIARSVDDISTNQLSRSVTQRISVGNSTGEQVASTETIQAAQKAQINSNQILEDELGETVFLRWISRDDSLVRRLHARFHGQLMTRSEANRNINISPWNCRCGFQQVTEGRNTTKSQDKFDQERKQMLADNPTS